MIKKSIGLVNCYGKEILESTARTFEYSVSGVTSQGVVILWEAWEVLPDEPIAMVQSDCDNGVNVGE